MHMGPHGPSHRVSHGDTWAVTPLERPRHPSGSVAPQAQPPHHHLAEPPAESLPAGDRALDVVLGAPERELSLVGAHGPGRAAVAVERQPDASRVDQVRASRTRTAELLVAVAEDDRAVVFAADALLVLGLRFRGETVVVAADAAMDVQNAVHLRVLG